MAAKLVTIISENQRKLMILAFAILAFSLFGFLAPSIKAQVSKSARFCTSVGNVDPAANPCKQAIPPGSFVYYCQADPKWGNTCKIWMAGCGPTSAAMIASTFGVTTTPLEMDQAFQDSGARICGDNASNLGTFIGSNWLENHGLDSSTRVNETDVVPNQGGFLDLVDAKRLIDLGYLILTSSHFYPCQGDGWCLNPNASIDHVFVIDQVDVAGNSYEVRDPANCSQPSGAEGPHTTRVNNFRLLTAYAITTRQK